MRLTCMLTEAKTAAAANTAAAAAGVCFVQNVALLSSLQCNIMILQAKEGALTAAAAEGV